MKHPLRFQHSFSTTLCIKGFTALLQTNQFSFPCFPEHIYQQRGWNLWKVLPKWSYLNSPGRFAWSRRKRWAARICPAVQQSGLEPECGSDTHQAFLDRDHVFREPSPTKDCSFWLLSRNQYCSFISQQSHLRNQLYKCFQTSHCLILVSKN